MGPTLNSKDDTYHHRQDEYSLKSGLVRSEEMEDLAETLATSTTSTKHNLSEKQHFGENGGSAVANGIAGSETEIHTAECGFGGFKPRFLQPCANVAVFTGVYSMQALITSTLFTYVNSQVTTLERQFGFSSSQTGLIMAANDIGYLSCVMIFSYLAFRVHIPRTLSILCVLFGVSGIICALPHFLFGAGEGARAVINATMMSSEKKEDSFGQLCLLGEHRNATKCEEEAAALDINPVAIRDRGKVQAALVLIVIGMMMQGICKSPRWPYVTYYVDGNIGDKTKTGFYLGIVVALAIFGPVLAFILGGLFTKMYVTLEDTTLTPKHPKWIGAWWLGFLVFGIVSIIIGLPLFGFPRWLKGQPPKPKTATAEKSKPSDEATTTDDRVKEILLQVKEFPMALWRLITNPIYTCLVLSSCFILFSVGGLQAFMPKYIENQFSLPAWRANLVLAVTSMITASFGTFVGGFLTRYFKMTPLSSLRFITILQFLAVTTAASGFFLRCDQPAIHHRPGDSNIINTTCYNSCECDDDDYLPVCGSDGRTYFSPCHAGCSAHGKENSYTNCTCIEGGKATAGVCDYGCDSLYWFAVLQALSALCSCMTIMPKVVAFIRCVSPKDKAFALGCSSFMSSLLGWLMGPVIFGNMIDGVCSFWERTCEGRGTCLLYDNDVFRVRLFSYVVIARAGGFLCIALAYLAAIVTKRLDGTTAHQGVGEGEEEGQNKGGFSAFD